jgi:hypothetical protein
VHAASIVVVRMIDGAKAQPPQSFKPAAFLEWAKKQKALAKEVVSCYEAGPIGFWLHRQPTALGIRNYVVFAGQKCRVRFKPPGGSPVKFLPQG